MADGGWGAAEAADRLERSGRAVVELVRGMDKEAARWRPSEDAWSVVEVVCHLADEERDDFRTRLDLVLHHPKRPWPPIDPEGWARERDYRGRNLEASLLDFEQERARSVGWLRSLGDPDWTVTRRHGFSGLSAGDLLVSWVAHDLLHVRQLARTLHRWLEAHGGGFSPGYAGGWDR